MKQCIGYSIGHALVDSVALINNDLLDQLKLTKGLHRLVSSDEFFYYKKQIADYIISQSAGGSTANSIYLLSQLGLPCCFSGKIADDFTGQLFLEQSQHTNFYLSKQFVLKNSSLPTGECLALVMTEDGDRTMLTHLGCAEMVDKMDIDTNILQTAQFLFAESYLLAHPLSNQTLQYAIDIAKKSNIFIALSLSAVDIVQHHRSQILNILNKKIDLLIANQAEVKYLLALETCTPLDYLQLRNYAKYCIITLGEKGCYLLSENEELYIPAQSIHAIDTVGAGDVFAGALIYGLQQGYSFYSSGQFAAALAAAITIQHSARFSNSMIQSIFHEYLHLLKK